MPSYKKKIGLIYNPAEIRCHISSARFHERSDLFGISLFIHIIKWRRQKPISRKIIVHTYKINVQATLPKRTVVIRHTFHIIKILTRSARVFYSPPVWIVKCSQFPSCVDFTGFNCIQNCVYCYYLSFFSKIALKHRPHYFHI